MKQKEILFSGAIGSLHGYHSGSEDAESVALVLPPHPKYGGTMKNKVVNTIFDSFVSKGFATLKMNFRGVGYSEGSLSFDESDLLKDANSAIEWLQSNYPLSECFWIGGFSSGAWLGLNITMRRPEISGFVAVSPPFKMHDFSFFMPCMVPGLMIQGTNDKLFDAKEATKVTSSIASRVSKFRMKSIEGADYKISGYEHQLELGTQIKNYLSFALTKEEDELSDQQERELQREDVLEEL